MTLGGIIQNKHSKNNPQSSPLKLFLGYYFELFTETQIVIQLYKDKLVNKCSKNVAAVNQ